MRLSAQVTGIKETLARLEKQLGKDAVSDVDKITETYARKMSADSARFAPILDGFLRGSIASSPEPDRQPNIWRWGSNLPYARRQEYEHSTNKAFIRRAIWDNEKGYRDAVIRRITKG